MSYVPESSCGWQQQRMYVRGLGVVLRQKLLMVLYSSYCECEAYNWTLVLSDDTSLTSHIGLILFAPEISGYFAALVWSWGDLGAILEILVNCLRPAVGHLRPSEFQLNSSAVNKYHFLRATRMKVGRKVSCHMEDTSKFPSGYLGKHRNQYLYQTWK